MQVSARAGGEPVKVSDELFSILQTAQMISNASGGALDVTIGPLSKLWREARANRRLPTESEIEHARQFVDWGSLIIDERGQTAQLRTQGMSLDLGGIAKGYAADRAARTLRSCGLARCMVALAGDIAVGDPPPNAKGWTIAVAPRDDDDGDDRHARHLLLANACISTSGDAEQHIEIDGVRHSHIINPRTGCGITNPINVTVIAPRGEIADACASAVSVVGYTDQALAEQFGIAILIDRTTSAGPEREIVDPHHLLRLANRAEHALHMSTQ